MARLPGWKDDPEQEALGWDFEGARRFQAQLGLRSTPAQRLEWLEQTVAEMQELCGLARRGRPMEPGRENDTEDG